MHRKEGKVNAHKVRRNSLSIHHTWLRCSWKAAPPTASHKWPAKWKSEIAAYARNVAVFVICRKTFSLIYSLLLHYWELSLPFAVISLRLFLGKFSIFFSPHLVIFSIQAECVCLIFQKYTWFTRASISISPLPSLVTATTVYHLLDALHIVWFVSVGVTVNIKNRRWKENT